jgi:hypothetical protein
MADTEQQQVLCHCVNRATSCVTSELNYKSTLKTWIQEWEDILKAYLQTTSLFFYLRTVTV